MDTHVDKFKVTVEGFEPHLSVQSFELDLAVNKIPIIQLNVLPVERAEPGKGHYTTASTPDIQEMTRLYSRLLKMTLTQDAKAKIKIDIETFGSNGNSDELNQTVTLTDWILTDVGLSTVTATAAPVLTVVFSHPAVMLDKTGFVYERISNSMLLSEIYKETGGSDIIEYMDDLYQKFADGTSVVYCEIASHGDGGPKDEFRSKVQEIRHKLSEHPPGKYIEGNMGEKMFLQHIDDELVDNIKEAVGPVVAPLGFSGSTWRRLVSQICPSIFTSIVPTYDRPKLLMEPTSPWQECSYKVNTPVVSGIDMVSVDPSPIIGVASEKDYTEVLRVVDDANRSQVEAGDDDYSYVFYFPQRALQDNSNGEILGVGRNAVIADILATDRNANAERKLDGAVGQTLQDSGNGLPDEKTMALDEAYVKAVFQLHYRQNCAASITTIPLLKDEGAKLIYPGRVMTVFDKKSGSKLFYGYITTMIVRGSTDGSGGSTTINMSHARPTESGSTYIDEGEENPCYPKITDRKLY